MLFWGAIVHGAGHQSGEEVVLKNRKPLKTMLVDTGCTLYVSAVAFLVARCWGMPEIRRDTDVRPLNFAGQPH